MGSVGLAKYMPDVTTQGLVGHPLPTHTHAAQGSEQGYRSAERGPNTRHKQKRPNSKSEATKEFTTEQTYWERNKKLTKMIPGENPKHEMNGLGGTL